MIVIKQQTNVQGGGYMKRAYTNPYIEICPLYKLDVLTESKEDPDAGNDAPKDDIFG